MTKAGARTGAKCRQFILDQGCVGIYEFAHITGFSYKHVYEMVRLGRLNARKVGGIWLIPRSVLEAAVAVMVSERDVTK